MLRLRRNHRTTPTSSRNAAAPTAIPAIAPPLSDEGERAGEVDDVDDVKDVGDREDELTEVAENAKLEELLVVEAQCVNVLLANCAWSLDIACRVYSLEESIQIESQVR